jgi:hypothetical protein
MSSFIINDEYINDIYLPEEMDSVINNMIEGKPAYYSHGKYNNEYYKKMIGKAIYKLSCKYNIDTHLIRSHRYYAAVVVNNDHADGIELKAYNIIRKNINDSISGESNNVDFYLCLDGKEDTQDNRTYIEFVTTCLYRGDYSIYNDMDELLPKVLSNSFMELHKVWVSNLTDK